jgi:uncharacterized membrane protein YcaP (DUF421 family)
MFWSAEGVRQLVAGGTPLLLVVARTAVVYLVLVFGLRVMGKREVGQFTPFDLVLILLIANAVQNGMVGADNTLTGALVSAVTLLLLNRFVGRLVDKRGDVRRYVLGQPTVLVNDGQVLRDNMTREDVTDEELAASIREHGFESAADVHLAVLEVDGTISVVPKDATVMHTRRRVRQLRHGE